MNCLQLAFALCVLFGVAPVQAEETLMLTFTGDIMLDDGPGRVVADGRDPLVHFADLLTEADYTIGNLECPVADVGGAKPGKIFAFEAKPSSLKVVQGRFDAVSLANNHSSDYGRAAFLQTIANLDAAGIKHFGGGRDLRTAHRPLWIEAKGLRVAVLGYDEFKPRAFEAGPDWAGVAWSEDAEVVADIRAARAAGADLVIPFMHWGWEREPEPTARQRSLAHLMIDAGADVVIGAHPHITQGAEYYRGKLIVYSLGNFVFDSFTTDATRTGWLLRLGLNRHGMTHWDTRIAFMDEEGIPQPRSGAASPCGKAGDSRVQSCANP